MASIRNTGKQTIYLNTGFRAGGTIQSPLFGVCHHHSFQILMMMKP